MKKLFFTLAISTIVFLAFAHGGEDHSKKPAAATSTVKYFSSEALSDKYEVLVKYGELEGGKESIMQLFLSEAKSNRAIDSATLSVKAVNNAGIAFALSRQDTGVYQVKGVFPENAIYDLQVNINSALGPDFLQVPKIEIGKKLEVPAIEAHDHWYSSPWLWAAIGLILGLLAMYFFLRSRYKKAAAASLLVGLLLPTASINNIQAHGGEDHGGGTSGGGGMSSAFIIEKESQFLFDITTTRIVAGGMRETSELTGTVTASPQGLAVIQTPQTGKIVSLRVTPGQTVAKGQILAVVEQQVEAGTQIDMISQRNTLNAEVKAAKVQYDRLLSISDIAAKKDLTEAKARYEAAVQNLRLFNSNIGNNMGNTKMVSLAAPISGVVGTFNYAIGAVVSTGQTLFEITNLNQVFVETQAFAGDLEQAQKGQYFEAFSNYDTARYSLRLVSTSQAVNTENQAQRVVFEIINPGGKFKIGENIRVLRYGAGRSMQLVVPTAAVTDVGGRAAVFIKDKAEQYSISFIQKGESNALNTAIAKGIESGERIVTGNVYQMKMIYLNQ